MESNQPYYFDVRITNQTFDVEVQCAPDDEMYLVQRTIEQIFTQGRLLAVQHPEGLLLLTGHLPELPPVRIVKHTPHAS